MSSQQHWEAVYRDRAPELVTWYQEHPALSLSFIAATGLGSGAGVVDVGGGCSLLTDYLIDQGYTNITVLDLSSIAMGYARQRLGDRAEEVTWIEGDVLEYRFDTTFDVWHDRAVFHFLTDPADRALYRETLERTLKPDGRVVIATFAVGGPSRCSGLEIVQYDRSGLSSELGSSFELIEMVPELHVTPTGAEQAFNFFHFRMK